jgi:tRNA-2-methylthio-N6-dimethylallyladenosine synthase
MNRRYDSEKYLSLIDKIRSQIPDIAITSDIIVGFPGENEKDFDKTIEIIEKVKFDMLFSFIYSIRTGTPAADMTNQVSDEVKGERFSRLLAAERIISENINKTYIGKTIKALPESYENGIMTARSETNKLIRYESETEDDDFVYIKITGAGAFNLIGKIK